MKEMPFQPLPSHKVRQGDIVLAKRHPSAPELRCEGMLLTVIKIHPWGVSAYTQLPAQSKGGAVERLRGYQECFSLGWMDFVLTGGRNPNYDSISEIDPK